MSSYAPAHDIRYSRSYDNPYVDTFAGGVLVPEGIILPVCQCFATDMVYIRYIYSWNLQLPNNVIINKYKANIPPGIGNLCQFFCYHA